MTIEEIQLLKRRTTSDIFLLLRKKIPTFFRFQEKIFLFFNSPSGNPDRYVKMMIQVDR